MVYGSEIQGQAGKLRRAADNVGAAVQHRARQRGVKMRPWNAAPELIGVPLFDTAHDGDRFSAQRRQVVGRRLAIRVSVWRKRQHRASVEVKVELAYLVY